MNARCSICSCRNTACPTRRVSRCLCISEALLRIPDDDTAEALIAEKIGTANWAEHVGHSDSVFLNASTWALMLTGNVIGLGDDVTRDVAGWVNRLTARVGESVARAAMSRAVRIVGGEFVLGRTIEEALAREPSEGFGPVFVRHAGRGRAHLRRRQPLCRGIPPCDPRRGQAPTRTPRRPGTSGISIKLSALHPRFEPLQRERVMRELDPTVLDLAHEAASRNIHMTIDAEEAERLELTLEVFERLAKAPELASWEGLGIAIQAYAKRAPAVIDWLDALQRPVMVRLVKGAYWDTEIKYAQIQGLSGYPVYTRKPSTDLAYLSCAARLFRCRNLFPQFATHNAHTLAAVLELARWRGHCVRIPASARHGGTALRRGPTALRRHAPRAGVCPGGRSPRPARLPGAPSAGEWCQFILRKPLSSTTRWTWSSWCATRSRRWRTTMRPRIPASRYLPSSTAAAARIPQASI